LDFPQTPELPPTAPPVTEPAAPSYPASPPAEDPVWSIPDVFLLTLVTIAALFFSLIVTAFAAQRWYFHGGTFLSVATRPMVAIAAQILCYLLFFLIVYVFISVERGQPLLAALSWNWPRGWRWTHLLIFGVALSVGLELILRLLPTPKTLPVNELFKTPLQAFLLSIFSVSLGPLFEEFFFRGFMYPALARRLGRTSSVVLTAILFALVHTTQLANAWAPVLMIFIVGVALGAVRAVTRSLASSLLVHIAYNSNIAVLLYFGTDGYRHLERLTQ
jgi:membrane protease YdiL (CAAX protease family)